MKRKGSTRRSPGPPPHLSARSKALWSEIVPRRARSPERLALLQAGLEALDRVDDCRAVLAKEGLTFKTKTTDALHCHPLVKVEKEQRQLFIRCWDALSLQWNREIDGRSIE